jgi:ubiquinone/menaquinone biosynthesis C-methylase UbiE
VLRRLDPARLILALVGAVALTFALSPRPAAADSAPPAYRYAPASIDGIGKFYEGREIAQVMGFDGAPWLDRATREREERPDWLVEELRLKPGMVVADIGAGSGYLSRRIVPLVPGGKVYALDVQPQMVALLEKLSQQPGMENLVPRQGAIDDVQLPPESVDLAVFVDVYHELAFPREVMRSVVRALKPGGRVAFVEYRAEDPRVPIKPLHKMSTAQVRREMAALPLVFDRDSERLPWQHILIFRKP